MRQWEKVRLGEVLIQVRDGITLEPEAIYNQVTVKINYKGVTLRGKIQGSEVASKQYLASKGQFIISKIDARNRAYGIVPDELNDAVVTGDFLLFNPDERLDADFLNYFAGTEYFHEKCKAASEGSTNRVRLKIDKFHKIEIPLPLLTEQRRIVAKLKAVQEKIAEVKRLRAEQGKLMANLLFSKYLDTIEGARWEEVGRIAPLVRREVEIKETESYPELGVRSFGKGTFHKPALSGIEVGTKTIYKIATDDLIFSNVFAWEGAIAVATKADDGRYASHRFITCVTDEEESLPEFLCYHFLTEKGMEDINAASPGGAGRNKTLGLKKLEKIKVPVPSIKKQREFLALKTKLEMFNEAQAKQLTELEGVFPGMLGRVFKKEDEKF